MGMYKNKYLKYKKKYLSIKKNLTGGSENIDIPNNNLKDTWKDGDAESVLEQFAVYLDKFNYQIIGTRGYGNCFFFALMISITFSPIYNDFLNIQDVGEFKYRYYEYY